MIVKPCGTDIIKNLNIKKAYTQDQLLRLYFPNGKGICASWVVEYVRHHIACRIKGKIPDFQNKIKTKIEKFSPNFIDRIKAYNDIIYVKFKPKIYRTDADLINIFDYHNETEFIALNLQFLNPILNGHRILIHKLNMLSQTYYIIIDSNFGETAPLNDKHQCVETISIIKQRYMMEFNEATINIAAVDIGKIVNNFISCLNFQELKQNKYFYRGFKLINERNFNYIAIMTTFTKIDLPILYKRYIHPATCLSGYVSLLDEIFQNFNESQIKKILVDNDRMNLNKSLPNIIFSLFLSQKFSKPIMICLSKKFEAFCEIHSFTKNQQTLIFLNSLTNLANDEFCISGLAMNDSLILEIASDDPVIMKFIEKIAYQKNKFFSTLKSIKSISDEHVEFAQTKYNVNKKTIELEINYNI